MKVAMLLTALVQTTALFAQVVILRVHWLIEREHSRARERGMSRRASDP